MKLHNIAKDLGQNTSVSYSSPALRPGIREKDVNNQRQMGRHERQRGVGRTGSALLPHKKQD